MYRWLAHHRIGHIGRSSSMKITDVKTATLQGNFSWTIVKVFTDEGLSGLGECYWGMGVETAVKKLGPLIVGEDPHNIDWHLWRRFYRWHKCKCDQWD
jgi:L-alanine-DL-glutamate epimerase-like enolase superfamily enzyme